MWEKSLPKNRKWTLSQGFVVFTLGVITISSLISLELWLESSLEPWSMQFSGSSGDFFVGMITEPISFIGFMFVGFIGYLVACKLSFFQDN